MDMDVDFLDIENVHQCQQCQHHWGRCLAHVCSWRQRDPWRVFV